MSKRSTHIKVQNVIDSEETTIRKKKGNTAIEEEQDVIGSDGTIIGKKKGNTITYTREAAAIAAARAKAKSKNASN